MAREKKDKTRLSAYKEIPFLYSVWYIVLLSAFVYLTWFFDVGVYGVFAVLVLCGFILAFCRDLTPAVPFAFFVPQFFSGRMSAANGYLFYIIGFSFVIIGFIVHLVRFRPFENYGKVKGFPSALFFAGIAIALGGVTIPNRSLYPALICVGCGLSFAFAGFFVVGSFGKDGKERLVKIVISTIIAASVLAAVQMFTVIFRTGDPIGAIKNKYAIDTGYGHPNYLANIISRSIPLAVWLSVRNKKGSPLWLFFAFFLGICILITSSRAVLLVALILSVACLIYFFPKLENKIPWVCCLAMLVGISMIGLGAIGERITKLFATITKNGFNSSGRIDLWKIGLERFAAHPIFGVGFDYDLGGRTALNPTNTPYTPYWYHNTVVQMLCSTGIFGTICFIPYFIHQYRTMFATKRNSVSALAFVLIMIQAISLLDIAFFTPQEFLQMIIITAAGVKMLPQDKGNSIFYPICGKIKLKTKKNLS